MSLESLHFLAIAAADFNPRVERTFNNTIIAFDVPSYKVEQLQNKIIKLVSDESKKLAPTLKSIGFTHPVYTMNVDSRDFADQRSNVRFLPTYNGPKEIPSSMKSKIMDKAQLLKWVTKNVEESIRDIKKAIDGTQTAAREVIIDNHDFQIKAKYSAYQMIFQIIPRGHKISVIIAEFMPKAITNIPIIKVGPSASLMYKTDAIGPAFLDKVVQIVQAIIHAARHNTKYLKDQADVNIEPIERTYLYDYRLDGKTYSFDIIARSVEDADRKMRAMREAWYVGELILRVPLPESLITS